MCGARGAHRPPELAGRRPTPRRAPALASLAPYRARAVRRGPRTRLRAPPLGTMPRPATIPSLPSPSPPHPPPPPPALPALPATALAQPAAPRMTDDCARARKAGKTCVLTIEEHGRGRRAPIVGSHRRVRVRAGQNPSSSATTSSPRSCGPRKTSTRANPRRASAASILGAMRRGHRARDARPVPALARLYRTAQRRVQGGLQARGRVRRHDRQQDPFDEKECVAACAALENDVDNSAAKVQQHVECVNQQSLPGRPRV